MKARQILKRDKRPRPVLVCCLCALLLMMSKADKLALETEPVARDNNTILTLKPGETLSRLTQLIIVVASPSSELMNASMTSLESDMSRYFSVLVGQLLEESSAIIVFTLHFAFILRSDGITAPTFKARRGF